VHERSNVQFHYSWLIILMVLAGCKEKKLLSFLDRKGKYYVAIYESLGKAKDNKNQQENNIVFAMLLEEIQHCKTNVWHTYRGSLGDRRDS
jgi:hypothetical protein